MKVEPAKDLQERIKEESKAYSGSVMEDEYNPLRKYTSDDLIEEIEYAFEQGANFILEELEDAEEAVNIAFKEGQSSPKIKQLEWKYDDKFFIWEANSVFGKYSFVDNSLIVNKKLFFRGKVIAIVLTIDEAKAAAQADFEKRVMECLDLKAQQKQALIDMMRGDEELGLYDE